MSVDTETGEVVREDKATISDFECSQDIAELSKALCKAQGAMKGAVKDSSNPFFKSKYADLSAVWDDVREPFAKHGLSVIQMPTGGVGNVSLVTQITHDSGQWIRSKLTMVPVKTDPQGIGSCITYARRYALAAMAGVYQIDDDGNQASAPQQKTGRVDDSVYIDEGKIQELAQDARHLVDMDNEEDGPKAARELYEPLNTDERMRLQAVMKSSAPEGCKQTYWAIFHKHLQKAAK
jgi:hypothetical protein